MQWCCPRVSGVLLALVLCSACPDVQTASSPLVPSPLSFSQSAGRGTGMPIVAMPSPATSPLVQSDTGLPSATALSSCACWGFIAPTARAEEPSCSTRVSGPRACAGVCLGGGTPWQWACY